jgi:inhibitor of KinA
MSSATSYSIYPLGNTALVVDFGNEIDQETNQKVMQAFHLLKAVVIPYVTDLVPAYSSLAIYYDVLAAAKEKETAGTVYEAVALLVQGILADQKNLDLPPARTLKVPVCYAPKYALDLEEMAVQKACSVDEIILWHTAKTYTVFMLGFLPGFTYMGLVDERLQMPRKKEPRRALTGGSVGIAGRQTGIYPMTSPGGWQIIGKTPLKIFNKEEATPTFFIPGDKVLFYSITENEFENY